nr:MAG TPA: hypothetical protein [Caudoviricetes sp.]
MSKGIYRRQLPFQAHILQQMFPYHFNILLAKSAGMMVSSTPNNTDSQFVTSLMSENSGNIKPTINPAKDSFDKSKKYPANFSRLVSDFFRFSSFIFLTRSKLLIFFCTLLGKIVNL